MNYVVDEQGKKVGVLLSMDEYNNLIERIRGNSMSNSSTKKGIIQSLNKFRGAWKNSSIDGLEFQKEERSEWEKRE